MIQVERFKQFKDVHSNAQMNSKMLYTFCELSIPCKSLLSKAMDKLGLSARAYDRI